MSRRILQLADLEDELSTVESYEWTDRRTEEEHHYFEITAPSYGDAPLTAGVNVLEDGVEIFHETGIEPDSLLSVITKGYAPTESDEVWLDYGSGLSRGFESLEAGKELELLEYYNEDPRFDVELQDISEHVGKENDVDYGFRLAVHSRFGIPLEDHLEEVVQNFMTVMLRKDTSMESRRRALRDTMVILDPDRNPDYYNVGVEFHERPEDILERYDPER